MATDVLFAVLASQDIISPTDSSKSKVLRKKKSRWGNEKVELPPTVSHIPTPLPTPVHIPTAGARAPGVASNMQLGQAAPVKRSVPCEYSSLGCTASLGEGACWTNHNC